MTKSASHTVGLFLNLTSRNNHVMTLTRKLYAATRNILISESIDRHLLTQLTNLMNRVHDHVREQGSHALLQSRYFHALSVKVYWCAAFLEQRDDELSQPAQRDFSYRPFFGEKTFHYVTAKCLRSRGCHFVRCVGKRYFGDFILIASISQFSNGYRWNICHL